MVIISRFLAGRRFILRGKRALSAPRTLPGFNLRTKSVKPDTHPHVHWPARTLAACTPAACTPTNGSREAYTGWWEEGIYRVVGIFPGISLVLTKSVNLVYPGFD